MDGSKTYIIAGLTAAYAIAGLAIGMHDFDTAITLLLGASCAGALRHGIAKSEANEK